MTRALHLELADLHEQCAWSLRQPGAAAVLDRPWRCQGPPASSSLLERIDAGRL